MAQETISVFGNLTRLVSKSSKNIVYCGLGKLISQVCNLPLVFAVAKALGIAFNSSHFEQKQMRLHGIVILKKYFG